MGKFIKYMALLGFSCALAYGFSYLGARTTVGKILGIPAPEVGTRSMKFMWEGVPSLPGKPRVWQFSFSRVAAIGNQRATIWVSPTGKLVAMTPKDLATRLEAAAKAKQDAQ